MEIMKQIPLEEHKSIANNILHDIKDYCDQEGIIYYIAFGTTLGAVRHQGFIPWDDDIDIIMTRSEYEKFKKGYNARGSKYRLVCNEIDPDFWAPLPKVIDTTTILYQTNVRDPHPIGVYVDIFVYDNVPDNKFIRKCYFAKMLFIHKSWSFIRYKRDYKKNTLAYFIYKLAIKCFSPVFFVRKLHLYAQQYNNVKTSYFGCNEYCSYKYLYKKEWFGEGADVVFEGVKYRTAKDWDSFLKCVYGDYMKLPPVEQRVSTHPLVAFYKENENEKNRHDQL